MCFSLQGEFVSIVEVMQAATHKLSRLLIQTKSGQPTAIEQMQAAATEIVQATVQIFRFRRFASFGKHYRLTRQVLR
jgi:hypothetical protein